MLPGVVDVENAFRRSNRKPLYSADSAPDTGEMPGTPLFLSILLTALSASFLLAQPQPRTEFKADSQLGELYLIGRTESTADKKIVITAEHLLISVDSAKLALRFPNRDSITVGGQNQQLLLLSGTIKNPQRGEISVTGGQMAAVRVFGAVAGQVYHVEMVVETESLERLKTTLKPDQSARYTMVIRVPSDRPALTMALLRPYGPIRRYDFAPVVTRANSVFLNDGVSVSSSAKAVVGQSFDLDSLDLKVTSVREVANIGSYASSAGKNLYAAEIQVTNRMLVPEKWGWQYCTPNLKDASDNSIPWSRDMLDAQSGQTFSRDLAGGETASVVYVFTSGSRIMPGVLTLQMVQSKRQVDIALKPL